VDGVVVVVVVVIVVIIIIIIIVIVIIINDGVGSWWWWWWSLALESTCFCILGFRSRVGSSDSKKPFSPVS